MCLIVYAINEHPEYPFVLIANRDEFYKRETARAMWWKDHQNVFAGRDLEAGGTWMGVTKSGKIAAITNYRDLSNIDPDRRSRGELPVEYLVNGDQGRSYLEQLHNSDHEYNGYNLLVGDREQMYHYSNYENRINETSDGVFGLSNALLDTPWPKVEKLKEGLRKQLVGSLNIESFFELLQDDTLAPDDALPSTGVSKEWEKALSSVCIKTEEYGTCSSTVIMIDRRNQLTFAELIHKTKYRDKNYQIINFTLE